MLRRRVTEAIIFAAVLLGTMHIGLNYGVESSAASIATQFREPSDLADGDLVFRTGRDMMARLVLSQGKSPRFSHVGVVVKEGTGTFVVHALPDDDSSQGGVRKESLLQFLSAENAVDAGFFRTKDIDSISRMKMRTYVYRQIGKPFDKSFRYSDDTHVYCTELALKALAAGGIDLLETIQHLDVPMLSESVFSPDSLRGSYKIVALIPNPS